MPFDAVFMSCLRAEVENRTVGSKIDKIQQPERDTVVLGMRGGKLLISLRSSGGRVQITDESFENPAVPSMFCMLLRKHLSGGRILSVTQSGLERAYDFEIECYDMLGGVTVRHLIVELLGRYTNLIITDENMNIIDCIRRIGFDISDKRQVLPGLLYRLPPVTGKDDPMSVTRERFYELLSPHGDKRIDKWLNLVFDGFSPLICREISYRAYGVTDIRCCEAEARDDYAALWASFSSLISEITDGNTAPYILFDGDGKPYDFSYTWIRQYENAVRCEKREYYSELLTEFYSKRDRIERMKLRTQTIYKNIRRIRDRTERKLSAQKSELLLTLDRDTMRENGDIITSNLYRMKKGMTVLIADDFYSENGGTREIKLDPLKTPQQNAADYYKNYTKAKTAEVHLKIQIEKGESELTYLDSVLEALSRAESEKDITEIRQELTNYGYIRAPKNAKREKEVHGQPMHFVSSSGFDIWVGKNNIQNDRLTMKTADRRDIWLHAQKIHGSHVIISTGGGSADDTAILEAANLAAFYSQSSESTNVPVDYTLVRYVKKPAGAKAGMVIYTEQKTVYVTPDPSLPDKLRAK